MTISTTAPRIRYTGDGATVLFAVPFEFFDEEDLLVVLQDTGVDSIQVLNTDYTVAGGDGATGSITMAVAPTAVDTPVAGDTQQYLAIINNRTIDQGTTYTTGGAFPAASHELAMDKLTVMMQRVRDLVDRAPNLQDGDVDGSGLYDFNTNRATNAADPSAGQDLVTLSYLNTQLAAMAVQAWVTNINDTDVDDSSDNVAAMRIVSDPYPGGVESLATNLATEIRQLRYQLQQIIRAINDDGAAYWYSDVDDPPHGLIFLAQYTPTAVASQSILLPGGYDAYTIEFMDIRAGNDPVDFNLKASVNAGVAFLAGASDYAWTVLEESTSVPTLAQVIDEAHTQIDFIAANAVDKVGSGAAEAVSGTVKVFPGDGTAKARIFSEFAWFNSPHFCKMSGAAIVDGAVGDVDAIQFAFSAGVITSGTINVYGHRS